MSAETFLAAVERHIAGELSNDPTKWKPLPLRNDHRLEKSTCAWLLGQLQNERPEAREILDQIKKANE